MVDAGPDAKSKPMCDAAGDGNVGTIAAAVAVAKNSRLFILPLP